MLTFEEVQARREIPRDGYGRPLVVPKAGGKAVAHRRTTTFIDVLEDKSAIGDWRARGTMIGTLLFPEVVKEARNLDPEDAEGKGDKKKLNELAEKVFDLAGFNAKREKGTYLHKLSEGVDRGEPLPDLPEDDLIDMMAYMVSTFDMEMLRIEEFVVVNELLVGGTPDRVLHYRGPGPDGKPFDGRVIGDLKTGRIDYGQLKIAAQLAIYARGEVYDYKVIPHVDREDEKAWKAWKKTEWDAELAATAYHPMPADISREWGIIINLRPGSGVATLHWADLRIGWEAALHAQEMHRIRRIGRNALIPFDKVC